MTKMNPESSAVRESLDAKALAILGMATFWAVPFAPLVAITALHRTRNSHGWGRRFAVIAAILCSVYTIAIASWLFALTIHVLHGGLNP